MIDVLLTAAAVLMVSGPLLFTHSGLALDFTNSLWMVWVAGKMLAEVGHPEFFVDTTTLGVFYPLFAFYGGPLFMVAGAISELLGGHAVIAFVGVTVLAIIGVYVGMLWLGREFGLRGLVAHAPALTVLTSAYFITNLYGRGAWTEFMVTSAIAPLLASGVHLVRAQVWRPLPVAIFAVSTALFTGGHNITLLWGTTLTLGALLILWLALGASRQLPYQRLAMLGGLACASALVNAWFLLPDVAYAGRVEIARNLPPVSEQLWSYTKGFNLPGILLDPLRRVPHESTTPGLYVQVPDWFIAWSVLAAVLLLGCRAVAGTLRRIWIGALIALALLLGMIMVKAFWQFVGYPFAEIQFPYRLGTYVYYATAGLVLVAALGLQRVAASGEVRRAVAGLRIALGAVVGVSVALCLWQQWVPNTLFPQSYRNRYAALASPNAVPTTWYDTESYRDRQAPVVSVPKGRVLVVDPAAVHGDRFAAWMNVPPGPAPIQTNFVAGAYLMHIGGLRLLGSNPEGLVVGRLHGGSGPVYVVLETTHSAVIELGRVLSIVGILAVLAILLVVGARTRRRSPGRSSERARAPRTV
jgi:hypothetical protein